MINRVSYIDNKFPHDLDSKIELDFDYVLDIESVYKEIKKLSYKHVKIPSTPSFIDEECVQNSTESFLMLSWRPEAKSNAQGYILEIDDGSNGSFKEVYCGPDTICQINGLSSDCIYNARVKAFNKAGTSDYSQIISLPSSESLWSSFNTKTSHSEAVLTNSFMTATCSSFEDRVILGSIGMSKGVHYWQITIEK